MGVREIETITLEEGKEVPKFEALPRLYNVSDWSTYAGWLKGDRAGLAISQFKTRYNLDKTTKQEGRGQFPMLPKEGKTEADNMISAFLKHMMIPTGDHTKVKEVNIAVSTTWLYGYIPGHSFTGVPKRSLPHIKITLQGEVEHILFQVTSFLLAVDFARTGAPKVDDLEDFIKEFTRDDLKRFPTESQVRMLQCTPPADSILFVPAGWIVSEFARNGPIVTV